MAIANKDFFPAVLRKGLLADEYEALAATVARANQWINATNAQVINIETVVLPNVENEEEAAATSIRTSGKVSSYWYQVVRVWHEAPDPPA